MKEFLITFLISLAGLFGYQQNLGGTVLYPYQGGTGTSTLPTVNQILIGNNLNGYDLTDSPTFLNLTVNGLSGGGVQCLQADNNGLVSVTGAACDSGAARIQTISNIGTGQGLFDQVVGTDAQFYSLLGTGAITVSKVGNDVVVDLPTFPTFLGVNATTTNADSLGVYVAATLEYLAGNGTKCLHIDNNGLVGIATDDCPSIISSTDDLAEGSTNLYYTDQRVATYINSSSTIAYGLCSVNQILEWNGSAWACINTPAGGGGGGSDVNWTWNESGMSLSPSTSTNEVWVSENSRLATVNASTTKIDNLTVNSGVTFSNLAGGGTQCVRVDNDGVPTGTGSDCLTGLVGNPFDQWLDTTSSPTFANLNLGSNGYLQVSSSGEGNPTPSTPSENSVTLFLQNTSTLAYIDASSTIHIWGIAAEGGSSVAALPNLTDVNDALEYTNHYIFQADGSQYTGGTYSHTWLTDIGTYTHSQLDSHYDSTSNPHSVTAAQVGAPSLAGDNTFTGINTFDNFPLVSGVDTPTSSRQLTTKDYVDAFAGSGFLYHAPVEAASTDDVATSGPQTIDGYSAVAGDRILLKDQTIGAMNGCYVVVDPGDWTRCTDYDSDAEVVRGSTFLVLNGTANGQESWALYTTGVTLDETPLVYIQISPKMTYTAGNGLNLSSSEFKLGGSLTEDTSITQGNYDFSFNLSGNGDFRVRDGGVDRFQVNQSGMVGVGDVPVASTQLFVTPQDVNTKGLVVKGLASQSAPLLEVQDSSGTSFISASSTDNFLYVAKESIGDNSLYPVGVLETPYNQLSELGYIDSPFLMVGEYQNYLLQTEVFDNATWVKTSIGTVTANSATDPRGTTLAENIPAGSNADANVKQTITSSATGNWTFSVWLKAQSGTANINLELSSSADDRATSTIPLTTGWKRYYINRNYTLAHTTKTVKIISGTNAIAAWGAQFEPNSYARRYSGALTTAAVTTLTRTAYIPSATTVLGGIAMSGALSGATTGAFSSTITNTRTGLAQVSTDGLIQTNTTASTAPAPVQMSPRIRWSGTAWNTSALSSVTQNWKAELMPVSGNPPTANFIMGYASGTDAYSSLFTFTSSGDLNIAGNSTTTGSTYLGTSVGLNNVYINNWTDLNSVLSITSGNIFDQWLDTTSTPTFAGLNVTTTNIDTLVVNTSLSGTGFDNAWDDRFAATTTWAGFQNLWDTAYNATTTNAGALTINGNVTTTGSLQVQDIATLATTTMAFGSVFGHEDEDHFLKVSNDILGNGATLPMLYVSSTPADTKGLYTYNTMVVASSIDDDDHNPGVILGNNAADNLFAMYFIPSSNNALFTGATGYIFQTDSLNGGIVISGGEVNPNPTLLFTEDGSISSKIYFTSTTDTLYFADASGGYNFDNNITITGNATTTGMSYVANDVRINGLSGNIITTNNVKTSITDLDTRLYNQQSNTKEITGFPNRTDSALSFNSSDRNFTITGTNFKVYSIGVEYTKNTESIEIANTNGLHYIYYAPTTLTLTESSTIWSFDDGTVMIATVFWNGTEGVIGDERHGLIMDGITHEYLHDTVGVRYQSGLTGTFNTDNTFSTTLGIINDEDIEHSIPATSSARILYRNGSDFTYDSPSASYFDKTCTDSNLCYDNSGVKTPASNNQYVAYWIFATNDPNTAIYSLMGQRQDTTLANAQANATYQSLSFGNLPFSEMKLLYRVIVRNNVGNTLDISDYRSVSNLPSGTYVATAHNILTGLDFASAGHTGFAGTGVENTFTATQTLATTTMTIESKIGSSDLSYYTMLDKWVAPVGGSYAGSIWPIWKTYVDATVDGTPYGTSKSATVFSDSMAILEDVDLVAYPKLSFSNYNLTDTAEIVYSTDTDEILFNELSGVRIPTLNVTTTNVDSLTANTGITLGGVFRNTWPAEGGGGGAGSFWVTTTDSLVGYPNLSGSYAIVIGGGITTTEGTIFEVTGNTLTTGNSTTTGSGYFANSLGLNSVYIQNWTDLNNILNFSLGNLFDQWLDTTSSVQFLNATTTGHLAATGGNSDQWNTAFGWGNWATGAIAQSDYYATTTWAGGNNALIVTGNSTTTGNSEVTGDLTVGGGITLGGEYRNVWPAGGSGSFWATTTDNLVGYPTLTGSYAIVVGSSATTSSDVRFEVNGSAKVNGLFASSTSLIDELVATNATSSRFYADQIGLNGNYATNWWIPATYIVSTTVGEGNFTSIQDAINALPASGGKIFVKAGTYTITSSLNIGVSKTTIEGEGNSTTIQCNGASVSPCLTMTSGISQISLGKFKLLQTNASKLGVGMDSSNVSNVWADQVRIESFATGTQMIDTANLTFYHQYNNMIYFDNNNCIDIAGTLANDNTFTNIRCRPYSSGSGIGLYIENARGLTFNNLDVEPSAPGAILGVRVEGTSREIVFNNPWIENNNIGVQIDSGAKRISFFGGTITGNNVDLTDNGDQIIFFNVNKTGSLVNYVNGQLQLYDPIFPNGFNASSTSNVYRLNSYDYVTSTGGFFTSAPSQFGAPLGINKAAAASIPLDIYSTNIGVRVESDLSTRQAHTAYVTGDSFTRFTVRADGLLNWGSGSAASDTDLYRNAANELKTDDSFIISGDVTTTGKMVIGNTNPTVDNYGLYVGGSAVATTTVLLGGMSVDSGTLVVNANENMCGIGGILQPKKPLDILGDWQSRDPNYYGGASDGANQFVFTRGTASTAGVGWSGNVIGANYYLNSNVPSVLSNASSLTAGEAISFSTDNNSANTSRGINFWTGAGTVSTALTNRMSILPNGQVNIATSTASDIGAVFNVVGNTMMTGNVTTTGRFIVGTDTGTVVKGCLAFRDSTGGWTYMYFNGTTQVISVSSCADTGANTTSTITIGQ